MGPSEVVEQFRQYMDSKGIPCSEEIIGDGKRHRFHVDTDKPGSKNGWYVLHLDENPVGIFGTWKDPYNDHKFIANPGRKLSERERREFEKRTSERKKQIDEETRAQQEETAKVVKKVLELCSKGSTPYCERKQIGALGALVPTQTITLRLGPDWHWSAFETDLIVPMRDETGKLWNLQIIKPDGQKRFFPGGRVIGCYSTIALKPPEKDSTIYIAEGFATAASIHSATGAPTVVAFNCGNLEPVAKAIRAKFPDSRIVIAADNDQWTNGNPGVFHARQAAQVISADVAYPEFPADIEGKPTDWNDFRVIFGEAMLAQELQRSIAPVKQPAIEPNPGEIQLPEAEGFRYAIQDWPIMDRHKPIACIENVRHLLDLNRIRVRYDVIRKDIDLIIPGENYLVDTEKNDKLTRIISIAATAKISTSRVAEFVAYLASQNPYNPVVEWIDSTPWDGVSRVQALFDTVKAVDDDKPEKKRFKETLMRKWCISAIAAAYRPNGVSAHGVLVFTGAQYVGKTNWFKTLVPQKLRLTKDGMLLDPKDKDSVYQIVSNWIVELGEIDATFRRADMAQLKAFVTKDQDTIRLPYRREPASFPRKTVFFASVNDREFLNDPTGNRRFWTIETAELNHSHNLEMQQVWAEFKAYYEAGESFYLTAEEMAILNERNKEFEVKTPIEELIRTHYDWDAPSFYPGDRINKTATQIALDLGIKYPTVPDLRKVAKAVRDITGQDFKKVGSVRVFPMPPSIQGV